MIQSRSIAPRSSVLHAHSNSSCAIRGKGGRVLIGLQTRASTEEARALSRGNDKIVTRHPITAIRWTTITLAISRRTRRLSFTRKAGPGSCTLQSSLLGHFGHRGRCKASLKNASRLLLWILLSQPDCKNISQLEILTRRPRLAHDLPRAPEYK